MKSFEKFYTEEYHSIATNPLNKQKRTVFINPSKDEIRELSKETNNVRFIAHKGNTYVFHGDFLHSDMIKHLGLPLESNPPINKAFLGVAKPLANGKLQFTETNQKIPANSVDLVEKLYKHLYNYFQ
jgi:hypothetical protein